jgi:hypothetical protein
LSFGPSMLALPIVGGDAPGEALTVSWGRSQAPAAEVWRARHGNAAAMPITNTGSVDPPTAVWSTFAERAA